MVQKNKHPAVIDQMSSIPMPMSQYPFALRANATRKKTYITDLRGIEKEEERSGSPLGTRRGNEKEGGD
jgi:hypothetical protein